MSEKDTSLYMKKIKQKGSETETVMEKIKSDRLAELDKLRIDAEMEEVKAKAAENRARIAKSQQEGQSISQPQTQDAMGASGKTILEAVRTGVEVSRPQASSGSNVESVAKAFADVLKTGVEIGRAQNPAQPQANLYETLVKSTLDELKATREQMGAQDRMRMEKEIAEIKARPSAMQEIAQDAEKYVTYRKMFGGTDSAITNEYVLKKLDMEQQVGMKKDEMEFEKQKWLWEKENAGKGIEQFTTAIEKVTSGPLGKLIEAVGEGAKARIAGGQTPNSPNVGRVKCPSCMGFFMANSQLSSIMCPLCGAQLEKPVASTQNSQAQTPQDTGTTQEVGKEESVDSQPRTA